MKIVYISASASGYGGENALLETVKRLPAGFEPFVILPEDGPLAERLEQAGIANARFSYAVLHRGCMRPAGLALYCITFAVSVFRFILVFRKIRPGIVHTNTSQVMPAALAARVLNIPHVWHIREVPKIHPSLWYLWRLYILNFSQKILCVSTSVKQLFGRSVKTAVVHDGIDTFLFSPRAEGNTGDNVRVGMIARINPWKGHDLFIEAAAMVSKKSDDIEFIIAGDARKEYRSIEASLRKKAEEYGIGDKVAFTGFLSQQKTSELINSLDIVIIPTKYTESFGLVAIEAMACGKAVIAPAEGGPLDIIEDGVSGILAPPRKPEAYSKAVLSLLKDKALRERMGREARRKVEENFTIERTVSGIVLIYRGLKAD